MQAMRPPRPLGVPVVQRVLAAAFPVLAVLAVLAAVPLAADAAPQPSPQPSLQPSPPSLAPAGTAPVELILDASGSMRADDGTGRAKIDTAKDALRRVIAELPEGVEVGLRVYGHRVPNTDRERGCSDTELVAPVAPLDRAALTSALEGIEATGYTPIGASLRAAADDLPAEGPRTVVLVSDGIDTCAPPDPCTVARELVANDVRLQVETVGFQVDPAAAAQLRCIAEVTGGQFTPVQDADELVRALRSFEATGTPVEGGDTRENAPVLGSGQYLDGIALGGRRWYAVDLEPGQRLRVVATIVGEPDGPVSATAEFSGGIRNADILGSQVCDEDTVTRIGQEARQVRADGTVAQEERICAEPGRYAVRLALDDDGVDDFDNEASPIEGVVFDVELLVAIVGEPAMEVEPSEAEAAAELDQAQLAPPSVGGLDGGRLVIVGGVAALVGLVAGLGVAGRFGP